MALNSWNVMGIIYLNNSLIVPIDLEIFKGNRMANETNVSIFKNSHYLKNPCAKKMYATTQPPDPSIGRLAYVRAKEPGT